MVLTKVGLRAQIVADRFDYCHQVKSDKSGVAVVGEHFNNSCGFEPTLFVGLALFLGDRSVQHKPGYGKRLGALIVEKGINVSNKLTDPGVQIQPLA